MYCKKCGNVLEPGDRFCNQCGTKVANDQPERSVDTGFSPMFRQESMEDTEAVNNKPSKRNFHIEDFNWDLDGYPTEKKKRTEDIDFNWESVLDERDKRIKEERVPLFREEAEASAKPLIEEEAETVAPEEGAAALEKEIFGDLQTEENPDMQKTVRIDKFYTFNKKNAEFQALLDKEYERLKNGLEPEEEELVTTEEILGGAMAAEPVAEPVVEPVVETIAEPVVEPIIEEPVAPAPEAEEAVEPEDEAFVGVAFAATPKGTVAYEEDQVAEPVASEEVKTEEVKAEDAAPNSEESKVCPPSEEKTEESKEEPDHKLTFDDIFADDDDDDIEKPKKKHTALKVIAIILCILIVLELVVIGLTHFAPESSITQWIISAFNSVKSLFTGDVPKG